MSQYKEGGASRYLQTFLKFQFWQTIKMKTERCFQPMGKMQFTWQSDCQRRDAFFHSPPQQVLKN